MEKVIHAVYDDARLAEEAAGRLGAAGVRTESVQIVELDRSGAVVYRNQGAGQRGSFDQRNSRPAHAEERRVGTFADEDPNLHDAGREHEGSFGDTEENVQHAERQRVGTFADGMPNMATSESVVNELTAAGLSADDARWCAAELASGKTLLLARVGSGNAEEVARALRMS